MKKRVFAILMTFALLFSLLPMSALATGETDTTVGEGDAGEPEALVEDTVIDTEAELSAALAAGGTVTLGGDITVNDAKELTVAAGTTINGGDYTLTFVCVGNYSYNAALGSSGAYTVKNLTIDATTLENGGSGSIAAFNMTHGGALEDVTVGSGFQYGVHASNKVIVTNCTFNNSEWGVYTDSANDVESVTGTTFNSNRATALYGDETFTGNTVAGNKGLSVATGDATITGNTFTGTRAMSITADAAISDNNIGASTRVEVSANAVDLSGNYWGGAAPSESQVVNEGSGTITNTTYYASADDIGNKNELVEIGSGSEGTGTETCPVYIGEQGYESLDAALAAAKDDGLTEVEITVEGDIKFSTAVEDFTKVIFTGTNREQTIDMNLSAAIDVNTELVFNDLTVSRLDTDWLYHYTYIRGGLTYNNCKMVGLFNVTAQDTNFTECDFYNDDTFGNGNYSLYLYNCAEGVEVNITDCTFDVYERAIKMYGDGYNGTMTLNISGTEFASRTADKTVVEMAYDNSTGVGAMNLTITDSTATGFGAPEHIEGEANAWFNVEGSDTVSTVTVDDVLAWPEVVAKIGSNYYPTLADAVEAAKAGDTVTLLADVTADSTVNINKSITLDGDNHKISGTASPLLKLGSDANITVQNATLTSTANVVRWNYVNEGYTHTYQNCQISGGVYGIHYDGNGGEVVIDGCTIDGFNAFAGTLAQVTVKNTTFDADQSGYAGANFWGNTVIENVTLVDEGKTTWLDVKTVAEVIGGKVVKGDTESSLESYLDAAAKIGDVYYSTLQDAIAAAVDGDTITLLTDVELTAPVTVKKSITIDGNGKTITQSADCDNQIALLYFEGTNGADLNVTVENVTFDGIKVGAALRTLYTDMTIDNVVFQNCEHTTVGQGLVRLTYGTAKITNSKFLDNTCPMGISFNWDGAGNADDTLTVDNCVFEGNTANKTALIYYVKGAGCTITNSEFIDNTVNCDTNGATVYLGFQDNCTVTGNLFKDNKVTDASDSTRVAGAVFAGYQATITDNAFDGNTAVNNGGTNSAALGQVCISVYYEEGSIDLSSNYWNGKAPVAGVDYTVQHQTGSGTYEIDDYNTTYTLDEDGNVVLSDLVLIDENGNSCYPTTIDVPSGASVVVKDASGNTVEPIDGTYYLADGTYTYTVSKSGYDTKTGSFTVSGAGMNVSVSLSVYVPYVPSTPSYSVTVSDAVNGTVTVRPSAATSGSTVTITVTPNAGYTLETLTVLNQNGKEIELTYKGDGKYTFKMPASKVTVYATFMEDNTMLNYFTDVFASDYYYDAVLWAVENGITNGTSATTFSPDAVCTRAQVVTFLWRAAGSPEPVSTVMPFTDVAADAYYYDAVLWAVENGITNGTSATTFSPDADCTRGQIVTFLWRSQGSENASGYNPFVDVANDAYYTEAVLWAVENGITNGTGANTFSPNADCTRGQIVTFLWRCLSEQ